MIKAILTIIRKNSQFIKFGVVGISNTIISYITYVVLVYLSVHYQIANITAFIISSFSGFVLNRLWVFKVGDFSILKQLSRYYLVYICSLLLSLGLTYVWIELVGMNIYLPPLVNLLITVPFNFVLNKLWAFRVHRAHVKGIFSKYDFRNE